MGSADEDARRVQVGRGWVDVDERGDSRGGEEGVREVGGGEGEGEGGRVVYKVYKRRWFGLVQLVLLNIIVSWDVRLLTSIPQFPSHPYTKSPAS